ncbi:MAG: hypothetical protein AB7U83_12575 [Vicinamibacterales bacterium]
MSDETTRVQQAGADWRELEVELGAPADTFSRLLKSDDWVLHHRLHALIEGAVSQMLTAAIGWNRYS